MSTLEEVLRDHNVFAWLNEKGIPLICCCGEAIESRVDIAVLTVAVEQHIAAVLDGCREDMAMAGWVPGEEYAVVALDMVRERLIGGEGR